MQLILYKTNDANRVINKTLLTPKSLTINLKRDTDIIRPIILLSKTDIDFKQYNYAKIVELNRYYFISHIESVNNLIDKLYLECDVLETYKQDIINSVSTYTADAKTGDNNIVSASSDINIKDKLLSDITLDNDSSIVITTLEV